MLDVLTFSGEFLSVKAIHCFILFHLRLQKRVEVLFKRSRPKYFTTASDVQSAIDSIINSAGIISKLTLVRPYVPYYCYIEASFSKTVPVSHTNLNEAQ